MIFFDNIKSFLNVGGNWSPFNWNTNFMTLKIPNFLKGSMFKAQKASAVWLILGNPIKTLNVAGQGLKSLGSTLGQVKMHFNI